MYIIVHKCNIMWKKVTECLKGYPERLSVARALIENGLSVKDGKIYCNDIEIPSVRIGRIAKVDRRTVAETIKTIEENPELHILFRHMRSAGHSLKEVARYLNLGGIVIVFAENGGGNKGGLYLTIAVVESFSIERPTSPSTIWTSFKTSAD